MAKKRENAQTFEQRMTRLQQIVETLENGNVTLEESIALYKEGMECSSACKLQLDEARNILTQVQGDTVSPFEIKSNDTSDDGVPF